MSKKDKKDKKRIKKEKKESKPLSILGLLVSIIKGVIKSIPKMWKSILIRSIISFLVVTGFSIYSIAVKNEGIGLIKLNSGKFWSDAVNTGGNETAFNVMSFILTYVITLIFSRIRNGGIKKFFKDVFGTIPWTKKCVTESKNIVGPLMFFSMGLVMILGIFAKNNLMFITLAITIFFEYASREKSLVFAVALAFWNDFHRVFKRKKGIQPINKEYVGTITFSLFLGMIILALIPINRARIISIILMIVFIALAVLLTYNKISKKAVKSAMFFIVFALMTQRLTGIVFADNGGWSEGGKSVTTYVGSAGSVGVFITSAVSGLFSVAGGLLGVTIGVLGGNLDVKGNWNYGAGMGAALGEDVAYVGIETVVGIKDLTVDIFTGGHLIRQTKENIDKEMTDFFDKGFQLQEKVFDWVDENVTTEVVLDTVEGMVKDINGLMSGEYAAEWIKEELQEFYNDPEAYANNAIEIIKKGGTLTGEASVAVEGFLNNIKNDPRAAYEIIKAISPADSIKNMIDPNKGLGERLLNVPFAAMDTAEILVGFGLVNIATGVAEQGVKLGVRTVIKEGIEEIAERGTKEVGERVVKEALEETGQRVGQEIVEEGGQRLGQEALEEVGQRGTKEVTKEAGQRGAQELTEEAGQRGAQELTEEAGQRGTKEVAEEVGERGTKETVEETGQRATQETVEEAGQRSTQETAENRVKNEIKDVDDLPPGKKDELINAQREYDEALGNAKDNTQKMIDDVNIKNEQKKHYDGLKDVDDDTQKIIDDFNSKKAISKEDVINSRGSIETRAAQGEKIGDAGRASDVPGNFVEEYNSTLKDVQRKSYDDMIDDLRKNSDYADSELRIKEISTPGKRPVDELKQAENIYYPGDKSADNLRIPDKINADNDFTVQIKNKRGEWEEIPHKDFENIYYEKYAERSGFTTDKAKDLYPDANWDNMTPDEQIRKWGERQGEMPTSISHQEGIRDFSTERTAQLAGEAPTARVDGIDKILSPKEQAEAGIGELLDPTQLSMAENHKFAEPWRVGNVHSQTEALEQLNKAGDLLGKLENGYRDMGRTIPNMSQNMQDGLKAISNRNLAPAVREMMIKNLGYRDIPDFATKVTSRFEFLKIY